MVQAVFRGLNMQKSFLYAAGLYAIAGIVSVVAGGSFSILAGAHCVLAVILLVAGLLSGFREKALHYLVLSAEILLILSAAAAVFRYLYALNANLDYVQRFMEFSGQLQLAANTQAERALVLRRYLPLLMVGIAAFVFARLRYSLQKMYAGEFVWFLPVLIVSAVLSAWALPSAVALHGAPWLIWFSIIPLFLALDRLPLFTAWRYGLVWGFVYLLVTNYWLATFSLLSLQTAVGIYTAYYLAFLPIVICMRYIGGHWRFVLMAAAWTVFEYLRSLGFLGYPWALFSHSQYRIPLVMQIAEILGVWGVSFIILLVNAAGASLLHRFFPAKKLPPVGRGFGKELAGWLPVAATGLVIAGVLAFGSSRLQQASGMEASSASRQESLRIALIQQNTDPRKADYRYTFEVLQDLSRQAAAESPDLIVWGETAFVPNIRRWGASDSLGGYSVLVQDFLRFQRELGVPLLTGNDDYQLVESGNSSVREKLHYNAAVLFDAYGQRVGTYHKRRLVPFTEHFPYGNLFPGLLETLESYNVIFWQPGTVPQLFDVKGVQCAVPICFEDIFPQEVRSFIQAGAELIVNISNDYWSLNPVQAEQHLAGSVFRAVENRVPMVRGTVSGRTAFIDVWGRITSSLPAYTRDFLVADVSVGGFGGPDSDNGGTLSLRWGDWFPEMLALALFLWAAAWVVLPSFRQARQGRADV